MVFAYCEKIGDRFFAVAFDKNLRIWATSFAENEKDALAVISKYVCPVLFIPERYRGFAQRTVRVLEKIYNGEPVGEDFALAYEHLTPFVRQVLVVTSMIPHGYVATYGIIGKLLGRTPRAVGRALAANPYPLLVPCHRVIRSDFKLGGYLFGTRTKKEILWRELQHVKKAPKGAGFKVIPLKEISENLE